MTLTTGWRSIVPGLMLAPIAVSEELKQADTQTNKIALYILNPGCHFHAGGTQKPPAVAFPTTCSLWFGGKSGQMSVQLSSN